jgi:eukaryotic-like serine/threonine-protein kinase
MEYIEGAPLKGPLPVDQALKCAVQICAALDHAHKKGITHRDLKPANILVTKTGIKLLDFGLAKLGNSGLAPKLEDATLTMALTGKNEIVGTLYYMSPEQLQAQANGQEIEGRSDIFSFGLVLYEMLTGRRAFEGSSPASVIAAIMERPAPSIAGVAPATLDRVLKRCLAKDPEDRWQDTGDLKVALEWVAEPVADREMERPTVRRGFWPGILAGACFAVAGVFAVSWWRVPDPAARPRLKALLEQPREKNWRHPTLSPDGTKIVFETGEGLRVRALDSLDSQIIPGTAGASSPSWSPDSRFLVYYSTNDLKKVEAAGGTPQTLASGLPNFRSATWNRDGTILFSTNQPGLLRISENGGTPTAVAVDGRALHPMLLPDGHHFLYFGRMGAREAIYAGLLGSKETAEITEANSQATFLPPDHLLFLRGTTLMAQPFDATALRTTGEAVPVADDVAIFSTSRLASFSPPVMALLLTKPAEWAVPPSLGWTAWAD